MLFSSALLKYVEAIRQIVLQEKANNSSMWLTGLLKKLQLSKIELQTAWQNILTCTNDLAMAKNIKNKPEIVVCRRFLFSWLIWTEKGSTPILTLVLSVMMIHILWTLVLDIDTPYDIMWWLTVFSTCYIFPISVTSVKICHLQIPPIVYLSNVKLYYMLLQATNQHVSGLSHCFSSILKCKTQFMSCVFSHLFDTEWSVHHLSMMRQSGNKHETWVGKKLTVHSNC